MSQIFHQIQLGIDEDLEEKLAWLAPGYSTYHILRQSVDARRRHRPHFIYSVEVFGPDETPPEQNIPLEKISYKGPPVIVIGTGPAGLFAALRLVEREFPAKFLSEGLTVSLD